MYLHEPNQSQFKLKGGQVAVMDENVVKRWLETVGGGFEEYRPPTPSTDSPPGGLVD
jgi:hypothetical protein